MSVTTPECTRDAGQAPSSAPLRYVAGSALEREWTGIAPSEGDLVRLLASLPRRPVPQPNDLAGPPTPCESITISEPTDGSPPAGPRGAGEGVACGNRECDVVHSDCRNLQLRKGMIGGEREMQQDIQGAQIFVALMLAAAAALFSVPGRTDSPFADIQWLLASSAAAEFDAISGSVSEDPGETIPP
jgi:hypothetical protein